MKIFIAGSRGQLGHDSIEILSPRHEVLGRDLPELDIASAESIVAVMEPFRPDVIINCAAFTKVDACETERAAALAANAVGPGRLARFAREHGARLIHISTDYVFDGARPPPEPYRESDPVGPVSYYGVTKLEGERAIAREGGAWAILRTAWLYGINGRNFLKTILKRALGSPAQPLKIVNDQYGSPTWSHRLARQVERVIESGAEGLFHATAEGYCTWYDFARLFLAEMGVACEVRPCTAAEYPTPARRPRNSILENERFKKAGINIMASWDDDVRAFARQHKERLLKEAGG